MSCAFDYEHIIPYSKIKKYCAKHKKTLPINNVGNICFLDYHINRRKKDKSIIEYIKSSAAKKQRYK